NFSLHNFFIFWLTCVNDFINNVTCTLNISSGENCTIYGYKKIRIKKDVGTRSEMPNISMKCNGGLVEYLKDYAPGRHIKMHPPGLPNVTFTDNDTTVIDWHPGSPCSQEIHTFPTNEPQLRIAAGRLKGKHHVRVKVKPTQREGSQWSEWSPPASLVWPESANRGKEEREAEHYRLFGLYPLNYPVYHFRFLKMKPVPNPSTYFQTLHGGNLKKWLNPSCVEYLHFAQPVDHISPVEVCEKWAAGPSAFTPPSSTCAPQPPSNIAPSAGSDEIPKDMLVGNSSSSSSSFSNLGYFASGSSSSSVKTEPNLAHFASKDDFHFLHKAHHRNFHLCPALSESPSSESFERGAQSPDSGFCVGKEDAEVEEVKQGANGEEVSGHCSSSPRSLPLHLPAQISCPSSPLNLSPTSSDSARTHAPTLAANVSAAGWPVACTTYRPSSMPVESCKAGYFVLQEIQTTFSNASI
uniref:Fibronectin type-III domain-containing protein n=1 Tax=Hippocampus comes TaxID=109280 RepID=A0A3Q2Z3S7_HIPCM